MKKYMLIFKEMFRKCLNYSKKKEKKVKLKIEKLKIYLIDLRDKSNRQIKIQLGKKKYRKQKWKKFLKKSIEN